MWLGELNEDEFLDSQDYQPFDADVYSSAYLGTYMLDGDLNGDTYVDATDYSVFDFPDALGGTQQELYGGVEYALPFNIVLGAVYNFSLEDDVKDYTEVSVSAPWVLAVDKEGQPTQSLVGKATQGLYLEDGEAVHTTLSLAYNYSVTKALTVSPFVEYNFVQDDYIQQEDGEYWGVKASFRF